MAHGWKQLLASRAWYRAAGHFPLPAYSEFMPPPRVGCKPYDGCDPIVFQPHDPLAWHVTEYEELLEIRPGLEHLGTQLVRTLEHLGAGRPAHGLSRAKLEGNPYWPAELSQQAGRLAHERYVTIASLALSRTQDDKGRVRWTLFGGSEQGPARAFWRGFFTAPGREMPAEEALGFLRRLLATAYGEPPERLADLHQAGLRILPGLDDPTLPYVQDDELPGWTERYLFRPGQRLRGVRYLLTFRPFGRLPAAVRRAYLAGEVHLLPFPGSLLFWGVEPFLRLRGELPWAMQVPLLHMFPRHEDPYSLRVPQSGWMHEPHADQPVPDPEKLPLRNQYHRTHRWARVHRHEDELLVADGEDRVAHVLFSAAADELGLYGKPMARNSQLWTHDFRLLLDGPRADRRAIERAAEQLRGGGVFGYRFCFPAMQVGRHAVYWHRPLVACLGAESSAPEVLTHAPLGYLTAYAGERLDRGVELWPRLLVRPAHLAAMYSFAAAAGHHENRVTIHRARELLNAATLWPSGQLPASFAAAVVSLPLHETLDDWLRRVEQTAHHPHAGRELVAELRTQIAPPPKPQAKSRPPRPLTYQRTATRRFEVAYWRTIASLAHGRFLNKDNADCVRDPVSQAALRHHRRDLEALGDYLLDYYRRLIQRHGMMRRATVGDLPFRWETDFCYPWSGGWAGNQAGQLEERDLLVMIPGRDRGRAVILADHYDTAYMEDRYEKARGGNGARLAAAGADDNHSATAALMLGAPVFLELSQAGRLACDVWLVHLTGEEFPSDCMGARHLARSIVERTLRLRRKGARPLDLSAVEIAGLYVMDMIAHNNDHEPDVFQISPGVGREALQLAYQAHAANALWNAWTPVWNARPSRRGCRRGRRSRDGHAMPATARHPLLAGQVRTPDDPRSSLYNTDGQIFSDAGIPAVLVMENYDINRVGYHDTHDTMANIDLDFGAAVAAITIEAVARVASGCAGAKL